MPATLTDRIPEIVAEAEIRAAQVVSATTMAIEADAKRNLVVNGSVVTGELVGSGESHIDGLSGEVTFGTDHNFFVEYGTGERGAQSQFEGKPDGITYSESWAGMTARPYLTPAAEAARTPFLLAITRIYA